MDDLNQYAISKILGSKMTPVKPVRFGNFGLLHTTAEALRAKQASSPARESVQFTYEDDALVVQAFESVRQGAATDALLWDKPLFQAFTKRCRELRLDASPAFLCRRLLNVRKSIRRYEAHGIILSPTTKKEPHPSIVPQYAHVIEFALVKLRFRYGASIDDILLDPALGEKFENLATAIAPGLSNRDLRLGALYLRKTRHLKKADLQRIQGLDPKALEKAFSQPVSLAAVDSGHLPSSPGIIELKEQERFLYISRNDNIRPAIEQLKTGQAFALMSSGFWTPNLQTITFQFVPEIRLGRVGMGVWESRLIHDYEPIFNWPIQKAA